MASTEGGDWAHGDWRRLKAMLGPNGAAPTHQDQQTRAFISAPDGSHCLIIKY